MQSYNIALIFATHARPDMLRRCLASIKTQGYLAENPEDVIVIVADNNPDKSGCDIVSKIAPGFPCALEAVHVVEAGLCWARNAGIAAGLSYDPEYVVSVDDDEWIEREDWLQVLVDTIKHYDADAVVGPVNTEFHPDTPDWFLTSGISQTDAKAKDWKTGIPSPKRTLHNTILKADMLRAVPEPVCPIELNGIGADDWAFYERAKIYGYNNVIWCAEAPVSEEMPISRSTWDYFKARSRARGASMVMGANAVTKLHPDTAPAYRPLLKTCLLSARLVLALGLLIVPGYRSKVLRQAFYVQGRWQAHFKNEQTFYK